MSHIIVTYCLIVGALDVKYHGHILTDNGYICCQIYLVTLLAHGAVNITATLTLIVGASNATYHATYSQLVHLLSDISITLVGHLVSNIM